MAGTTEDLLLEFVRARDVVTRHGARPLEDNDYLLRAPEGDGTYVEGAFRWSPEVARALAGLDSPAALGRHVATLAGLLRDFLAQAEWGRIDARIQAAVAAGRMVRLTLRSAAAELYLLPWEFLTIGGRPQCETPACLLRYEWPRDRAEPRLPEPPPLEGGRVVLAWSGHVPADEHIEAIRSAAREHGFPFDPDADVIPAATLEALGAALADERRPVTALHVLCHGAAVVEPASRRLVYGLALGSGTALPDAVRAVIERAPALRLVVLCACEGANAGALGNKLGSVAQQIHRAGVEAVISSRYPWTTEASSRFARTLYRGLLVDLRSVEEAFLLAQTSEARRSIETQASGAAAGMDHAAMLLHGRSDAGFESRPFVFRPYRGLKALSAVESRFLFGRDDERRALLERVARGLAEPRARFLILAGASGSGKSSLAMAGLIADLIAGKLAGLVPPGVDPGWRPVILRPTEGASPQQTLRERLGPTGEGGSGMRIVLIDQMEELFTQVREDAAREAFLRELYARAVDPAEGIFVMGTLRMEYLGHFGALRMADGTPFDRVSFDPSHHYLVRQLTPEQVAEIVRGPCARAGVFIEPGLEERLLAAAGVEPGALPLLAYAMDRLWELREKKTVEGVTGWWLTDDAYTRIGELKGAIAARLEEVLGALADDERAQARRLLVQLVNSAGDPAMATRRRRLLDELRPGGAGQDEEAIDFDRAAEALIDGRLCVAGSDGEVARTWIELAHEAIVRGSPRLQQWLHEDRDWRRATDELRELTARWELHQGAETAAEYVLSGRRLADARAAWARHGHHLGAGDRRRIEAFLATCEAEEERRARALEEQRRRELELARRAREFALVAGARELLSRGKAIWASKLLLESRDPETTRGWVETAKAILSTRMPISTTHMPDQRPIEGLRFTPDGREIIAAASAGDWRFLADGTGEVIEQVHEAAGGGTDPRLEIDGPVLRVRRGDGRGEPVTLRGHEGDIGCAVLSPDGQRVATAAGDYTVRLWNVDGSGAPVVLSGHDRDGHCEFLMFCAAFSPDGRLLATSAPDSTVRLWRLDGLVGEPRVVEPPAEGRIERVGFTADGRRAFALASDGELLVCPMDGSGPVERVRGAAVAEVVPAMEEPLVSYDSDVIRIRSPGGERETREIQAENLCEVALSPDGRRLALAPYDGDLRVIRLDEEAAPVVLAAPGFMFRGVAWSGDSRRLITRYDSYLQSRSQVVHVWDADGGAEPIVLRGHRAMVDLVALSPDGERAISAAYDGVRIWDLSVQSLRARLAAANADELPPDLRAQYLDEREAEARERYEAAMRGRGRVPARHSENTSLE